MRTEPAPTTGSGGAWRAHTDGQFGVVPLAATGGPGH